MAGSTYVEPHGEPGTNPAGVAEARAAQAAGMTAAGQRYGHYEGNVHGQGAAAGDPRPWPPGSEPDIGQQGSET